MQISLFRATHNFDIFALRSLAHMAEVQRASKRPRFSPVQRTALLTTFYRLLETQKRESLVKDDFASLLVAKFLDDEGRIAMEQAPTLQAGIEILACRTKFVDDYLVTASSNLERPLQVVGLGAGMCTRPYRLQGQLSQDVVWIELDQDVSILEQKHDVLREACTGPPPALHMLECDLSQPESLPKALRSTSSFDVMAPTCFILEGLLEYLPPERHAELFTECLNSVDVTADCWLVLQNLEPSFAESFNKDTKLPYQRLVPCSDQAEHLHNAAAQSGGRLAHIEVFRGDDCLKQYGRSTTIGWTMMSVKASHGKLG